MRHVLKYCASVLVILAATVLFMGVNGLWGEEQQAEPKQEQKQEQKQEAKPEVKKEEAPKKESESKAEPKETEKRPIKEEPVLFTSKGKAGKNLQVMAINSIADLQTTMKTITKSLGADCKFCHILLDFSKDEKTLKKDMARKMLVMMDEINTKYFKEMKLNIACITCHQGRKEPILSLADWEKMKAENAAAKPEAVQQQEEQKKE